MPIFVWQIIHECIILSPADIYILLINASHQLRHNWIFACAHACH